MLLALLACTSTSDLADSVLDSADTGAPTESAYVFTSALTGEDSVSYTGQVFRHVLIDDMKGWLGELTGRIDNGEVYPADGDVEADLEFYLGFDSSTSGQIPLGIETDPATAQAVYDDISSGKNLWEKLAGNDATGQHADWSTDFVGWPEDGVTTPESLVRHWVGEVDDLAAARVAGQVPLDPSGAPITSVYVSAEGQNYRQLLEKFLRGAVAFSQGTDDYLDDDLADKGLNADHTALSEGKGYTSLEHQWDEGFGYFGASRTYGDWTDEEIKAVYVDVDGDGAIDLSSEYCFGHSVNAAKRDAGAVVATDFTAQAFEGFRAGRQLLAETAGGELTAEQMSELQGHRDQAVDAWEKSISASVVHYINSTIQDTLAVGTDDYSFDDHAKHWSEMKGFALSLQFNPRSPLGEADFATLQDLMGTAPVLADADEQARAAYVADLLEARSILGEAYGFDAQNLGDDDGLNGW